MTDRHSASSPQGEDRDQRHVLRVERRIKLGKPYVVTIRDENGVYAEWTSHRTNEEAPCFPAETAPFDRIIAHDALEYVLDEEAWVTALANRLAAGGTISIRIPLEGPLAWMDARNIYRYVTDLAGRGTAPGETLPTGWRRHYRERDLDRILRRAGLVVTARCREGMPGLDIPHLAGLVAGDLVLQRPETESTLLQFRDRLDSLALRARAGALSTHLRIEAMKRPDQSPVSSGDGA